MNFSRSIKFDAEKTIIITGHTEIQQRTRQSKRIFQATEKYERKHCDLINKGEIVRNFKRSERNAHKAERSSIKGRWQKRDKRKNRDIINMSPQKRETKPNYHFKAVICGQNPPPTKAVKFDSDFLSNIGVKYLVRIHCSCR